MKSPKTTPLNKEMITFLVYRAKVIARSDGRSDSADVSMAKTL